MTQFIEYIKYMILGLVQGITEILPISSSGHLVLFQHLLNLQEPGLTFEMFTNMASFIAIVLLFYKDIWTLIKHFFIFLFKPQQRDEVKDDFMYTVKLVIAIIPIGIAGLLFKDYMGEFKTLLSVGIALFLTGGLLIGIYLTRELRTSHEEVTFKDALIMGLTQMFAIFPGISRSGSTIIGGRVQSLSLKSILKFSFLCYILISIPTSALSIYEVIKLGEAINWAGYLLAFGITLVATYFTGKLVMKKLKVDHLIYFGIYCVLIGITAFVLHFVI